MNELTGLLSVMVARDASDLYISVDAPPTLKIDGQFHLLSTPPLSSQRAQTLIDSVLSEEQQQQFKRDLGLDFSLGFPNIGRFRINIYQQKSSPAMVVRYIKNRIPSISELGLPDILHDLALETRGLILVVGASGTGKSTTLASMIDYRNKNQRGHILTIEDPIEYLHPHKQSLVSQREVGIDTHSYADGLHFGLRESPDVVMIGEIRDYNTAQQAIRYAETGHLCLSTLHATSADQALDRMLNFFPVEEQRRVRQDLAMHLVAILGQRLANGVDDKRVAAVEIMMKTPYIAKLIDSGETSKIKEAMNSSEKDSCQTFDESLFQLIRQQRISKEEGMRLADSRINLGLRFRLGDASPNIGFNAKHWTSPNFTEGSYRSAQIMPKNVHSDTRPEMDEALKRALEQGITGRAYTLNEDKPDLIFKYAFGLHRSQGLDDEEAAENTPQRIESGLAIHAQDRESGKIVWKLIATRPLGQQPHSQQEFNVEMENLLGALPLAAR